MAKISSYLEISLYENICLTAIHYHLMIMDGHHTLSGKLRICLVQPEKSERVILVYKGLFYKDCKLVIG